MLLIFSNAGLLGRRPPKEKPRGTLNAMVTLVWWTLWKERNTRVFTNQHSNPAANFFIVVDTAADWHFAGRSLLEQLAHWPREPD
jgi:hypothetical protein